MNLKLGVTILVLTAMPAFGQAQTGDPKAQKPTKADVQKIVQTISGDKTKMQAYCDLAKLNQQMAQADERKDTKSLEAIGPQADNLMQRLGPDYVKLLDGFEQVDENSSEGKEFAAAFDSLDEQCK
jgi:hypothetical protein